MIAATGTRTATCEHHGPFDSVRYLGAIWSRCPICAEAEQAAEDLREQQAAERAATASLAAAIEHCGLPERFRDRSLATFVCSTPGQAKAKAAAQRLAEAIVAGPPSGRSLMFVGRPGTGKTHLGAAMMRHLIGAGKTARYYTVQGFMRSVKDSWVKGSPSSESAVIGSVVAPDLLILDEVGVQFGSEFERQVLFDVLDQRYGARKGAVLISNLE